MCTVALDCRVVLCCVGLFVSYVCVVLLLCDVDVCCVVLRCGVLSCVVPCRVVPSF